MTGSDTATKRKNPFVGPRPIDLGQKIFGRDREIEQLYYFLSGSCFSILHQGLVKVRCFRPGWFPA